MSKQFEHKDIIGHPRGLLYLFFAELWERFSFYGMRALLTLYMVNIVFEALVNRDYAAAAVYASYGSLVYASTVIGGKISDSFFGFRKSIILGGIFMALGHFVLALENDITFYTALALIVVGNGFFKPNISSFVGALYKDNDPRKDSGYMIYYMGINIGGFVAPLLCGYLGATYGWHYGFGLAGIGMLTGLFVFWNGIKKGVFMDKGLPSQPEILKNKTLSITKETWIIIFSVVAVPIIAYMLSSYQPIAVNNSFLGTQNIVNLLFKLIGISVLLYLAYILWKATILERKKLLVAIFITFFMTLFWGFHELSGSVITLFADRNVDLKNGLLGWEMSAAQTNSLNSFFIILLSIPLAIFFAYLSKIKKNPRTPYKFALGMLMAGLSFYILSISDASANEYGKVPFFYLFVMYFIISVGELFMSPIGLSKITDLSPKRLIGFMMGVWFLSSAFAFQIVGFIGEKLAIESEGTEINSLVSLPVYTEGFAVIAEYALGAGVIILILAPFLTKLMGKVH